MPALATNSAIGAIKPGYRIALAHGLRKAGATIAAENGATAHQLMAIFGWDTLKQAEVHTKAANQKRLAENSMHLIEATEQNGTESGPTFEASGTFSQKP
jgi:hypothetical protein